MNKLILSSILIFTIQIVASEPSDFKALELQFKKRMQWLDRRIKESSEKDSQLNAEKLAIQSAIISLHQQLGALKADLGESRIFLRQRLTYLLRSSGQDFLKNILESGGPSEFERLYRIQIKMARHDLDLFKNHFRDLKELEKRKMELTRKMSELAKSEVAAKQQEKALYGELDAKAQELEKIRKMVHSAEGDPQLLEKTMGLSKLAEPHFFELKGRLELPIEGPVVQGFGIWRDPIHNVGLLHKGMFFVAPQGSKVYSVAEGYVTFVGAMSGLGLVVIVEHGDHYMTTYAHLADAKAMLGGKVKIGQYLGDVGEGSMTFGDGLYFELRHYAQAKDPKKWFGKRINIIVPERTIAGEKESDI